MTWENIRSRKCTVYGLRSTENGELRYVGQTVQSLNKRLDSHIHPPGHRKRGHTYYWIRSVIAKGFYVEIFPLVEDAIWCTTEIEQIKKYRELGYRLTNVTDGGEGHLGPLSEETKKKLSASRMGIKFTDEHKKNLVVALKKRTFTQEWKDHISSGLKGKMPKNIKTLADSVRGKPKSPEHRAKLSAALKGRNVRKEALRDLVN